MPPPKTKAAAATTMTPTAAPKRNAPKREPVVLAKETQQEFELQLTELQRRIREHRDTLLPHEEGSDAWIDRI